MNCTICGKPIKLNPSAQERSKKFGETPYFYASLFTEHTDCTLKERAQKASDLMRQLAKR